MMPELVKPDMRPPDTPEDKEPSIRDFYKKLVEVSVSTERLAAEVAGYRNEVGRLQVAHDGFKGEIAVLSRDMADIKAVETLEKDARAKADLERAVKEAREDEARKAKEAREADEKRAEREDRLKKWGIVLGGGAGLGAALMKFVDWILAP